MYKIIEDENNIVINPVEDIISSMTDASCATLVWRNARKTPFPPVIPSTASTWISAMNVETARRYVLPKPVYRSDRYVSSFVDTNSWISSPVTTLERQPE